VYKQPHLRGIFTPATANFEDQVAEAAFRDGRLHDDWDYFSFHGDNLHDEKEMDDDGYDLDEEEAEMEESSSFVTSQRFNRFPQKKQSDTVGVKHCFRWHPNAPCRKGARAGFCTRGWEEKCIRCRAGEGVNRRTGECASQGRSNEGGGSGDNSDGKVERCFRWHPSAACRRGGRGGQCIRGWEEKCIRCRRNEVANRITGECVPLRE
jgi:hypothetical protein